MKYKSFILFGLLVAFVASLSFVSCHEYESDNDVYSQWRDLTEADSVIFANARAAFINDPANEGSADVEILQLLSNPHSVRTKAVDKGTDYQFVCGDFLVTVFKGNGDDTGKVIEILEALDGFPAPIPPDPRRRDTLI